ncbi:hypothetical protein UCDDA912_g10744 [Diaporthe ampelina]|uniref:Uncharacterized protein n=1 Tax=Diaporthe ampelina TaxID=1214573 RepID=A0A0G2F3K7_9PEZI|nr:hypothetical protein UCDDA912_g10744 [Diaporthe ampelina]
MCRKNRSAKQLSERGRKAARDTTRQKLNHKKAIHEAYTQNQDIRDTWVEDINLQFGGVINVPATEEKAIKTATEASEATFDPSNRVFFTYGATVANKQAKEETVTKKHEMKRLAGAAVIYKKPTANNNDGSWCGRQWELGHCETTSGAEAGFIAISKCLSIAAQEICGAQDQDMAPIITIFTHDQDAINKISRVRYIDSTKECSDATPVLLDIVKKSQKLRNDFGAIIELNVIPRHANVEGNRLAEAAARRAATTQNLPAASY